MRLVRASLPERCGYIAMQRCSVGTTCHCSLIPAGGHGAPHEYAPACSVRALHMPPLCADCFPGS